MRARIVIVGGGVAGLATAWALAQRGISDVLVLEGETTLGSHSTAKNAAILRSSLGNAVEDRLAAEGARFLVEPPRDFAPAPLLHKTGLCLVARGERAADFDAWIERARALGRNVRDLDGGQFAALAPHFASHVERAIHTPDEGRIDLAQLVQGYTHGARSAGVRIETGVRVADLWLDDSRVRGVRLEDGTRVAAERVALAAGAWAGELGARAGSSIQLQPTRRHLAVTEASRDVDPDWPIVWSLDASFYARPEAGGLMLCACDETAVVADECRADPTELARIRAAASEHLGRLGSAPTARFWAGMRTFSQDRRFLIGPDPELSGLVWVAGLGGHGIVCGAAVGQRAADWLADDDCGPDPSDPVARAVDPRRFAAGNAGSGTSLR